VLNWLGYAVLLGWPRLYQWGLCCTELPELAVLCWIYCAILLAVLDCALYYAELSWAELAGYGELAVLLSCAASSAVVRGYAVLLAVL